VNFAYLGCFTDYDGNIRDLNSASYFSNSLTAEYCALYCLNAAFSVFGEQDRPLYFFKLDADVAFLMVHKVVLRIALVRVVEILMRYVVVLTLILFIILLHVFFI
jgi:hypothetical protein